MPIKGEGGAAQITASCLLSHTAPAVIPGPLALRLLNRQTMLSRERLRLLPSRSPSAPLPRRLTRSLIATRPRPQPVDTNAMRQYMPPIDTGIKRAAKESGTIASVFATLSGGSLSDVLPARFGALKGGLVESEAQAQGLQRAWNEVLTCLEGETKEVIRKGSDLIPVVQYPGRDAVRGKRLDEWLDVDTLQSIKQRGTVIVKGVIPEDEALGYKDQVRKYIAANPQTKGRLPLERAFCQRTVLTRPPQDFLPVTHRFTSCTGQRHNWPHEVGDRVRIGQDAMVDRCGSFAHARPSLPAIRLAGIFISLPCTQSNQEARWPRQRIPTRAVRVAEQPIDVLRSAAHPPAW